MELNINLNYQPGKKRNKKLYFILASITLLLAIGTGILMSTDNEELSRSGSKFYLGWFYLVYFMLMATVFFLQSKGKHIFDLIGKSYFRINDEGVECKMDMSRKEIIKFRWSEVDYITIKLFEVTVKVNKRIETINLEKLSDENLQLVKSIFKKHQTEIVSKDIMLVDDNIPLKYF